MASWRDIRRAMRRDVHREMGVPACYLLAAGGAHIEITVRGPHSKRPQSVGDLPSQLDGYAEREDVQPRLIFYRDQMSIPLRTGAIVSIATDEAYRIATVLKPDDETVTAEVVPLSASECAGLPVPAG